MNLDTDLDADLLGILKRALDDIHRSGYQRTDHREAEELRAAKVTLHLVDLLGQAQSTVCKQSVLQERVIAGRSQAILFQHRKPVLTERFILDRIREIADHLLCKKLHTSSSGLCSLSQASFKIQKAGIIFILIAVQGDTSLNIAHSSLLLKSRNQFRSLQHSGTACRTGRS